MTNFIPTDEQKQAMTLIRDFLDTRRKDSFLLEGFAGTGKSTLVNHILKDYYLKGQLIAVSAFTNKATNIISRKTPFAESITLYRLLGLQANQESDVLSFGKSRSLVRNFNIIVLDEVSMIKDSEFEFLMTELNKCKGLFRPKLLLMGDPFQLPPVGQDNESIAFNVENKFQLKNVIRQSVNSNILDYSMKIRKVLEQITQTDTNVPIQTKLGYTEGNDFRHFNNSKSFIESVLEDFNSDSYKRSSDYVKVIAYRNNTINVVNNIIRKNIFGANTDTISINENLMLNSPVYDPFTSYVLYNSSDEIVVDEIEDVKIYEGTHLGVKIKFPYYMCDVRRKYDDIGACMNIVNPSHYDMFNDYLNEWASQIKKLPPKEAKEIFRTEFYPFKKTYHCPSYNYAITSHKSQGSTYNKAYVIEDDIEKVKQASSKDLWKSKYVACTRPSKQLNILNRIKG